MKFECLLKVKVVSGTTAILKQLLVATVAILEQLLKKRQQNTNKTNCTEFQRKSKGELLEKWPIHYNFHKKITCFSVRVHTITAVFIRFFAILFAVAK